MKKINYFLIILIVFGANSASCTNPQDSMEVEDILRTTNKNGKEWLQIWGLKKLTENVIKSSLDLFEFTEIQARVVGLNNCTCFGQHSCLGDVQFGQQKLR